TGLPDVHSTPLRLERDLRGEPVAPEPPGRPRAGVPWPEHGRLGLRDARDDERASDRCDEGHAPDAPPRADLGRQDADRAGGGRPPDHRGGPGHLRDGPRARRGRGPVSRGRPRELVDVAGPDAVPEDAEHRADARAPPDRRPGIGGGDHARILRAGKGSSTQPPFGAGFLQDEAAVFESPKGSVRIIGSVGSLDRPTWWQRRNLPRVAEEYERRVKVLDGLLAGNGPRILLTHYPPTYVTMGGEKE